MIRNDVQLHHGEDLPLRHHPRLHGKGLQRRPLLGVVLEPPEGHRLRVLFISEAQDLEGFGSRVDLAAGRHGSGNVLEGEAGGSHGSRQLDEEVAAGAFEGPALAGEGSGLDGRAGVVGRVPQRDAEKAAKNKDRLK